MKKNLGIYILSSLVIFAAAFNYIIQPMLDSSSIGKSSLQQKKISFSNQLNTSIENLAKNISSSSSSSSQVDLSDIPVDVLKNQYKSYMANGSLSDATTILEKIYSTSPSEDILKKIIDNYLQTYDYAGAAKNLDVYRKNYGLSGQTLLVYLNTLVNSLQFENEENVNNFVGVINDLYAQNRIGIEDYNLYKLIITYIKGDKNNYEYFLSQPYTGYAKMIGELRDNENLVQNFRDPPSYYRSALDASTFFSYGYVPLAMDKAFAINKVAPGYILPQQIIAYGYFLQEKYPESIVWLNILAKQDYDHVRDYQYLLGVANYWNQDYNSAMQYFSQLADSDDKQRYMMLASYKRGDKDFLNYARKIEKLNEYDFYTIYNLAFEDLKIFQLNQDFIFTLLQQCKIDITQDYICDYGFAKYFYSIGEDEKAIPYFEKIVDIYKNPAIAYLLGQYYEPSNKNLAKKYYYQAALYSTTPQAKQQAKSKIQNL